MLGRLSFCLTLGRAATIVAALRAECHLAHDSDALDGHAVLSVDAHDRGRSPQ